MEAIGERSLEAELYRIEGELLLMQGPANAPRGRSAAFVLRSKSHAARRRESAEAARDRQLARLLATQDKRDERARSSPISTIGSPRAPTPLT
jgi:hypothetical protein